MKKMDKSIRVADLMNYIKLLENLLKNGFRCEKEMKEALEELHSLMSSKKPNKSTSVLVVEKDFDSIVNSVLMYTEILGDSVKVTRLKDGDDHVLSNENVVIEIIKQRQAPMYKNLQGKRYDYIINNVDNKLIYSYVKEKK